MSPEPIVLNDVQALVASTELVPNLTQAGPHHQGADDLGAIAAAHALIDVYATGAELMMAEPLVIGPDTLDDDTFTAVWQAIVDTMVAAGGVVGEGRILHSGSELLAGATVHGLVHPAGHLGAAGAREGDVVVLSKPIGAGVVLVGGDDREVAGALDGMRLTNRIASQRLVDLADGCHGVMGVKERGLLGHSSQLAESSGVAVVLESSLIPCYRGAKRLAGQHGGDTRDAMAAMAALVAEPQISGGLLAAVEPGAVDELVEAGFRPVGAVTDAGADPAESVARLV